MNESLGFEKKILGLIAHPIKHTYSPFIHNLAAELTGQEILYLPFDVPHANLKDSIKGIKALGLAGLNISIPHKEAIIPYLHHLAEEASLIGAINTIVNDHGDLIGYNTDVNGIIESLAPFKDRITGSSVSVIGAGGAARTAIYTLIRHFRPSMINIINRTEQKGESLAEYFQSAMSYNNFNTLELFPLDIIKTIQTSTLIINTTPCGMFPNIDDSPISFPNAFNGGQIVFDMVYNPVKTKLLTLAAESGATTISGLTMLIYQAAKSFELWTGVQMPTESIYNAILKKLA